VKDRLWKKQLQELVYESQLKITVANISSCYSGLETCSSIGYFPHLFFEG